MSSRLSSPHAPVRNASLPPPLRGFEHVNRYWDRERGQFSAKILPGEYYVTVQDELIATVLGSCVSACVRDPVFAIGGMNHFMLPDDGTGHPAIASATSLSAAARYGNYAMEHLINDVLKNGGRRENLEIKIFGGGRILAQMTDVGRRNIVFVRDYLRTEGFEVAAEDLGDIHPRKVVYSPTTGKVFIKKLRSLHNNTIVERETAYLDALVKQPVAGEIDLF